MRKAERLFEIIQILRLSRAPVTAARIAEQLEVGTRSVYRDIAALQAMRVPIEGGRGIGYVLRPGFELPPLMFAVEEIEAMVLALALLERTGDTGLKTAARHASRKIASAVPPPLRTPLEANTLYAWGTVTPEPPGIDLAVVREAIRQERKLDVAYRDEQGRETRRTICPIALIYYAEAATMVAWCELRQAIRHFRTDRVEQSAVRDERFPGEGERLRRIWIANWTTASG